MANIFTGSEIVGIGVQIEKNGRDFYRSVGECSSDENSKKMFKYLMEAEERHIEAFERILASIKNKQAQAESYEGEYLSYMKALAEEHIFTKDNAGCDAARRISSDLEAIDAGIGFERDSIKFYEGMKKVVPSKDHGLLEKLISEEEDHLRELGELKRVIKQGE